MTQERRLRILGLVVLLVFGGAWLRAAQLTTVSASSLESKLEEGRQPQTLAAPRGLVTDRKGLVLAISESASDISATPYMIDDPMKVAAQLSPLVNVPSNDLLKKLSGKGSFVYVAKLVPEEQVKKVRALGIDGLTYTPRTRRQYPQTTVASQLIGFAGVDGDGLAGIELALNNVLRGKDGKRLLVRGRGGTDAKVVHIKEERPVRPGRSVRLTLDARIQARAEDELAEVGTAQRARSATAIVMQPSTGEVLAMASWPRVDANAPGDAPTEAQRVNATQFTYEPGSTFKPFTVAGALEEDEVTPSTRFALPYAYQVADRSIQDSHQDADGTGTVSEILSQSSNIGTIQIAQKLGEERFADWIRKFGFGERTGVGLGDQEERGRLLDVEDYSGSSIGNLPIGQGELVTPMQLAAGYATIANDGVREQPTLVDQVDGKPQRKEPSRRIISATTARSMRAMLTRTTEAGGTATNVSIPGYAVAAKTGTANKVVPGKAEYSKTLYTSSIIGMAPASKPRIVVAVIVDEPKGAIYGAEVAGSTFKELTRWTLNYLGVAPD
ncbi:MAG: penicillin-binding protein 2 [Solirubrobacteraceae bacterium]|nr:penicillin-binding protein 2 [Solirubrobacteraceae bacterium]